MTLLSEILAAHPTVDQEAGAELDQIAEAALVLNRKGYVALKFVVEKQGARIVLTVGHESKPPKPDAEMHLWHVGPNGLTQDEPYQVRMDPATGELITPDHPRKD